MSVLGVSQGLLLGCGGFLILTTLLSVLRVDVWWIRIWDFPRHQLSVVSGLVLLGLVWVGDGDVWTIGIFVGLCISVAYQGWRIFPHLAVAGPEVMEANDDEDSERLSLLTANVLQPNRQADEFLSLVREFDPDILLAVETDEWWASQLRELEDTYPHVVRYPLDTTYGMLLFSRLELVETKIRFLVEDEIPSIWTLVKLPNGVHVSLHAVHPDPPNPRYATETTDRDAELLLVGREAKAFDGPSIVIGDFNDVAWSHTTRLFRKISGLIDPRVGRGFYNTFHAEWPLFRWPMDHIYHSTHFHLGHLERGRYFGSDHFPVYAELVLDPEASLVQNEPTADMGDEGETAKKISDASESDEPSPTM